MPDAPIQSVTARSSVFGDVSEKRLSLTGPKEMGKVAGHDYMLFV